MPLAHCAFDANPRIGGQLPAGALEPARQRVQTVRGRTPPRAGPGAPCCLRPWFGFGAYRLDEGCLHASLVLGDALIDGLEHGGMLLLARYQLWGLVAI